MSAAGDQMLRTRRRLGLVLEIAMVAGMYTVLAGLLHGAAMGGSDGHSRSARASSVSRLVRTRHIRKYGWTELSSIRTACPSFAGRQSRRRWSVTVADVHGTAVERLPGPRSSPVRQWCEPPEHADTAVAGCATGRGRTGGRPDRRRPGSFHRQRSAGGRPAPPPGSRRNRGRTRAGRGGPAAGSPGPASGVGGSR